MNPSVATRTDTLAMTASLHRAQSTVSAHGLPGREQGGGVLQYRISELMSPTL